MKEDGLAALLAFDPIDAAPTGATPPRDASLADYAASARSTG
jgi:hypothetical protein